MIDPPLQIKLMLDQCIDELVRPDRKFFVPDYARYVRDVVVQFGLGPEEFKGFATVLPSGHARQIDAYVRANNGHIIASRQEESVFTSIDSVNTGTWRIGIQSWPRGLGERIYSLEASQIPYGGLSLALYFERNGEPSRLLIETPVKVRFWHMAGHRRQETRMPYGLEL